MHFNLINKIVMLLANSRSLCMNYSKKNLFNTKCLIYCFLCILKMYLSFELRRQNMLIQHSVKYVGVQPWPHLHLILKSKLIM